MKKDFVIPVLVLALICLVISAALAYTNSITEPIIAAAAAKRAEEARNAVIPEADGFEKLNLEGLPKTVSVVYKTTNNIGYIFMLTTKGYGGDIKLICGIRPDGTIIACKTLEQSETRGMGSRIAENFFETQFNGTDALLEGVSAISGATISSEAYISAVKDAFAAFEIAKEASQ